MAATMIDSVIYGSLWSGLGVKELFDEVGRTKAWLEIIAVLAEVEAEFEIIPRDEGAMIARACRAIPVDGAFLDEVRRGRETSDPRWD